MKQLPWFTLAIGVWVMWAPLVFGYSGSTAPVLSHVTLGATLVASSSWILFAGTATGCWLLLLCGIWLLVSHVGLGALAVASSLWALMLGQSESAWRFVLGGAWTPPVLLFEGCTALAPAMGSDLVAGIAVVGVGAIQIQSLPEATASERRSEVSVKMS